MNKTSHVKNAKHVAPPPSSRIPDPKSMRAIMTKFGMTLEDLVKQTGIRYATLSPILHNNERVCLTAGQIESLKTALHCTERELTSPYESFVPLPAPTHAFA